MLDQVDHRLHDIVALDEIDLYGDVLSAVAASDGPLTAAELDHVLGLRRALDLPARAASVRIN